MNRTAEDVFEDHLRRRCEGDVEGDIRHNYAEDVVMLTIRGGRIVAQTVRYTVRRE